MDISKKPVTYFQIEDEDSARLINQQRRSVKSRSSRSPACTRVLWIVGALIVLVVAYVGGLLTEWRLGPLGNRFHSDNKNLTQTDGKTVFRDLGIRNGTFMPGGTNSSASDIKKSNATSGGGFGLTGPPLIDTTDDPTKNPAAIVPDNAACTFRPMSHLGFDGSMPFGDLRRKDNRIEREDVLQGGLGDCGLIASILALICVGMQIELHAAMLQVGNALEARFRSPIQKGSKWTYVTDVVKIDDTLQRTALCDNLPAGTQCYEAVAKSGCRWYLAAVPPSVEPQAMYVPLLEKAWAKYADANPSTHKREGVRTKLGYPGLEGVDESLVLQSLTGRRAVDIVRKTAGVDTTIGGHIVVCLQNPRMPCVVGTPSLDVGIKLARRAGAPGAAPGFSSSADAKKHLYTITEDITKRVFTLVPQHAYALDVENSPTGGKAFDDIDVTIINPWGYNFDTEGKQVGASVTMRLKTLASIVNTVRSVKREDAP